MPVQKYENFLSEDLYSESFETCKDLLKRGHQVFFTNNAWQNEIKLDSAPVFVHPIMENSELYKKLKNNIEDKTGLIVKDPIMFYYWTRYSYIPWHNDPSYDAALTIYLNDDWNRNFGGYFVYEDLDEVKCIIPKRNSAILQTEHVWHTTTPVNFNGDIRYTIQFFVQKEKNEKNT